MRRSLLLTSFALLSTLAAGCGSLASDTDQKEPLAVLQGELTNPDAVATSGAVRVAVIWVCGDYDGDTYSVAQDVEVQPVFPSKFRLELTDPPPADCLVNPFDEGEDDPGSEPPEVPGDGPDPESPPSDGEDTLIPVRLHPPKGLVYRDGLYSLPSLVSFAGDVLSSSTEAQPTPPTAPTYLVTDPCAPTAATQYFGEGGDWDDRNLIPDADDVTGGNTHG